MLSNLTLKQKLLAMISVSIVGFAMLVVTVSLTLHQLKINGPLYRNIVLDKDLIADVLPPPEYILESYLVVQELADARGPQEIERLSARMKVLHKEFNDRHDYWLAQPLAPDMRKLLTEDAYAPASRFYEEYEREFLPAVQAGDALAIGNVLAKLRATYGVHRTAIDRLVPLAIAAIAEAEAFAAIQLRNANILMGVLFVFVAGCVIGLPWLAMTRLLAQLGAEPEALSRLSHQVAKGDLAAGSEHTQVDVQSVLGAVLGMRSILRSTITQISEASDNVNGTSDGCLAGIAEVSRSSHAQSDAITQIASAMEEMSANVRELVELSQRASSLATHCGSLSDAGNTLVTKTVGAMEATGEALSVTSQSASALDAHSKRVSAIIDVIRDIAEQTNLLALNAAIEAARAGEQGRGFAVVADEVRNLSQRTQQSTRDIAEMITDIQRSVVDMISSIGQSNERVEAGVAQARDAAETISQIKSTATDAARAATEMVTALQEQRIATEQVAEHAEQVATAVNANISTVTNLAELARSMNHTAIGLRQSVSFFNIGAA